MHNHKETNKQLRIYDITGKFNRYSVDEAIANNFNRWKGWQCSAGVRGLYIDYDGNVWVGNCASSNRNRFAHADTWQNFINREWDQRRLEVLGPEPHIEWREANVIYPDSIQVGNAEVKCKSSRAAWDYSTEMLDKRFKEIEKEFFDSVETKLRKKFNSNGSGFQWQATPADIGKVWGLLGNIYNTWNYSENWVTCNFESCGCGADVILSKSKSDLYRSSLHVTNSGYEGQHRSNKLYYDQISKEHTAVEMDFVIDYQILWDISRRCNYKCSYCWPSVHNNTDPHHDWEVIQQTIHKAINEWARGKSIRWNFGGGEPTLHPKFLDILQILKDNKQWTMVTTNGSLKSTFWHKAKKLLNTVNFSCHFETLNEEQFLENVKIVLDWHDECNDDLWCEVKLMAPPGVVSKAVEMREKINSLETFNRPGLNNRKKGAVSIVPIRGITNASSMVDYSDWELEILRSQ